MLARVTVCALVVWVTVSVMAGCVFVAVTV